MARIHREERTPFQFIFCCNKKGLSSSGAPDPHARFTALAVFNNALVYGGLGVNGVGYDISTADRRALEDIRRPHMIVQRMSWPNKRYPQDSN